MSEHNVQVTQADRDAAADWCASQPFPSKQAEAPMIRAGEYDHHSLVQAFARHRTRAEPDLVDVPPLIERLEFASANRVCAAPGANGRLCGKCYRCLMRQAAKGLRAALTRADSRGE